MKTLDINTLEWFDKVNGNTYFASKVTIDYTLPTENELILPFQYGYGNQSEYQAIKELQKQNLLPVPLGGHLNSYCKDNNIILHIKKETD